MLHIDTPFFPENPYQQIVSDLHCVLHLYNKVISTNETQQTIKPNLDLLNSRNIHPQVPSMLDIRPKQRNRYAKSLARLTFLSKLLDSNFVLSPSAFSKLQRSDPDLKKVFQQFDAGNHPDPFILDQGVLCYKEYLPDLKVSIGRPALPLYLAESVLQSCHIGKIHYSVGEMKQLFQQHFYSPHANNVIMSVFSQCSTCNVTQPHRHKKYIQSYIPDFRPGECVFIDFYQNLPEVTKKDRTFSNILVCIDASSGYLRAAACESLTAANMVKALDEVLCNLPTPRVLVSDHAPGFSSGLFTDHVAQRGIQHIRSVARRSEYLGLAEHGVKMFRTMLQRNIFENGDFKQFDWLAVMPELTNHYNNQKISSKFPFSRSDVFLGPHFYSNFRNLLDEEPDTNLQHNLIQSIYLKRFKQSNNKSLPIEQQIFPGSIVKILHHKDDKKAIRGSRDLQPVLKDLFYVLLSTRTGILAKSLLDASLRSAPYSHVHKISSKDFLLYKSQINWPDIIPSSFKLFAKQQRKQGLQLPPSQYLGYDDAEPAMLSAGSSEGDLSQDRSETDPVLGGESDADESESDAPAGLALRAAADTPEPDPSQLPANNHPTSPDPTQHIPPPTTQTSNHPTDQPDHQPPPDPVTPSILSKGKRYSLRPRETRKLSFKLRQDVATFSRSEPTNQLSRGGTVDLKSDSHKISAVAHYNIFKPANWDLDLSVTEMIFYFTSHANL